MRPHGASRRDRDDDGFTLIELMVVILIVGILIAMALPTYLGAKGRAADRAAQADMRTGLAAALAYYSETPNWTGFNATAAVAEETGLVWVDTYPPSAGQVSIRQHLGQDLLLVALSASGTYFCLAQIATNPATERGKSTNPADFVDVSDCTGEW